MAASTAPAAKQAILNLLTNRPTLNTVQITWGEPTEQEDLQDEMVFFAGPTARLPEWRVLRGPEAQAPLDETYTLTLMVRNRVYDDDPAAAETRTWELVDEIEQAVRADTRLGGILRGSAEQLPLEFGEQEVDTKPLADGWYGEATVPLILNARI